MGKGTVQQFPAYIFNIITDRVMSMLVSTNQQYTCQSRRRLVCRIGAGRRAVRNNIDHLPCQAIRCRPNNYVNRLTWCMSNQAMVSSTLDDRPQLPPQRNREKLLAFLMCTSRTSRRRRHHCCHNRKVCTNNNNTFKHLHYKCNHCSETVTPQCWTVKRTLTLGHQSFAKTDR
jgi:hypothetical protein